MPCHEHRTDEEELFEYTKGMISKSLGMQALLCEIGKAYYAKKVPPAEAISWWKSHCYIDAQRGEPWEVAP